YKAELFSNSTKNEVCMLFRNKRIFSVCSIHKAFSKKTSTTNCNFCLSYIIFSILTWCASWFQVFARHILPKHCINTFHLISMKNIFKYKRNDNLREHHSNKPSYTNKNKKYFIIS